MTKQSEHYLNVGNDLMGRGSFVDAERAFRAAQNHLAAHDPDYLKDVQVIQGLIISALESQAAKPAAILGRKGGLATSQAKTEANQQKGIYGHLGGRPRKTRDAAEEKKVLKYWPKALGIWLFTRDELRGKYRTRLQPNGDLELMDRETGAFVTTAVKYWARKGQREA